jgi:hypothetical protein
MPNNKFWAPKLTISDRKCKEAYVLEERACVRGRRQRAFPIRCITQINNIFVPNWFVRFSHWQWVTRFGHTTHQQFHFSTFDSEVKFQCTRNGLQNLPFVRGHIARILFLPIFAMKLACCFVELASLAAPAPPPDGRVPPSTPQDARESNARTRMHMFYLVDSVLAILGSFCEWVVEALPFSSPALLWHACAISAPPRGAPHQQKRVAWSPGLVGPSSLMAPPCAGSVFDSRGYTVLLTAAATNIYVRVYSDAYIYIYIYAYRRV